MRKKADVVWLDHCRNSDGWLEQRRRYWFETREWAEQVATDPHAIAECDKSFQ